MLIPFILLYVVCVRTFASWKDLCQWDAFAYKSNKVSLQRWIYTLGKTQKTSWIKRKYIHTWKKRMTSISHCYLNHKTLQQGNRTVWLEHTIRGPCYVLIVSTHGLSTQIKMYELYDNKFIQMRISQSISCGYIWATLSSIELICKCVFEYVWWYVRDRLFESTL